MTEVVNPFYTGINIPDKYFCDREKETREIIRRISNGSNIVLKAARRIGKSSLVKHVFVQDAISSRYNVLYVDILGTKNACDFLNAFKDAFLSASFARIEKVRKSLVEFLRSIYFDVNGDFPGTLAFPRVGFNPGSSIEYTLRELFNYLEHTSKPNLVVFDEFQQIQFYPEKMAAILRGFIQEMNNTHFIFSGSERHMLSMMFDDSGEPFYRSSTSMNLDIIPLETYRSFVMSIFSERNRGIRPEAVDFVYYVFRGNTYQLQLLMKEAFALTDEGATVTITDIKGIINRLLDDNEYDNRMLLNRLNNKKERNTLFCIANESVASGLTSTAVMKKYNLDNPSSVQNALNNLSGDQFNLIYKVGQSSWCMQDIFLELWLDRMMGTLEARYERAEDLFREERKFA